MRSRSNFAALRTGALLAPALLLAGCATAPVLPGLSTAAAMEIEVDVYKGPLARTLTTQISDAEGVLDGAVDQMRSFVKENWGFYPTGAALTDVHAANAGCRSHLRSNDDQDDLHPALLPAALTEQRRATLQLCYDSAGLIVDLNALKSQYAAASKDIPQVRTAAKQLLPAVHALLTLERRRCAKLEEPSRPACLSGEGPARLDADEELLQQLAVGSFSPQDYDDYAEWLTRKTADSLSADLWTSLSTTREALATIARKVAADLRRLEVVAAQDSLRLMRKLEERAWYWGTQHLGSGQKEYREIYARFGQLVSDYANLIASRVDTVLKQTGTNLRAADLSTADHLRDAAPTAYLALYDWLETDERNRVPGGRTYGPLVFRRGADGLDARERVRMAEQLFDDRYWTNINRVYASGQGEVRMAFIRDEIGNWNLKSFQNDPEKLLDAYRKVSIAGLNLIAKVAAAPQPGRALVDVAGRFAAGRTNTPAAVLQLSRGIDLARADALANLTTLQNDYTSDLAKRQATLADATAAAAAEKTTYDSKQTDVDTQSRALESNGILLNAERARDPRDEAGIAALENERLRILADLNTARTDLAVETAKLRNAEAKEASAKSSIGEAGARALNEALRELQTYQKVLGVAHEMVAGDGAAANSARAAEAAKAARLPVALPAAQ
jgi:hypothetical protein